jgi:DNA (cytosine-5)-methyltransferase 3A
LYWTNIKGISILEDMGIYLKDILEENPEPKYYLSDKMIEWLNKHATKRGTQIKTKNGEDKSSTITATATVKGNLSTDYIVAMRGRNPDNPKSRVPGLPTVQMLEAREDGKTNCLTTLQKDNLVVYGCDYRKDEGLRIRENGKSGTLAARARNDESCGQLASINSNIRKLTPIECERLQTVKDNYTNHVSDSQRYKMLGNGWTVDVIAHIFKHLTKQ